MWKGKLIKYEWTNYEKTLFHPSSQVKSFTNREWTLGETVEVSTWMAVWDLPICGHIDNRIPVSVRREKNCLVNLVFQPGISAVCGVGPRKRTAQKVRPIWFRRAGFLSKAGRAFFTTFWTKSLSWNMKLKLRKIICLLLRLKYENIESYVKFILDILCKGQILWKETIAFEKIFIAHPPVALLYFIIYL